MVKTGDTSYLQEASEPYVILFWPRSCLLCWKNWYINCAYPP